MVEIKVEYMKYIVILQFLRVYKDSVLKIYISFTQHCMELNMLKMFEDYLFLNNPGICMFETFKTQLHKSNKFYSFNKIHKT